MFNAAADVRQLGKLADTIAGGEPVLDRWHNRWMRAVYPRGQHYAQLGRQLADLSATIYHWDPARREIPDEAEQLTAIIDQLTELRDQLGLTKG